MFGRKCKVDDFSEEINAHLQLEFERQRGLGLSEEEAWAAARRAFGNVTQAKERLYESSGWLWWDQFWRDTRYGARSLCKAAGFTAVAALTLALGIGASTAMFGVLSAVLLRPLPFPAPEQLIRVLATEGDRIISGPSPMDVRDFAAQNRTIEKFAVYDAWPKNVSTSSVSSEPEQLQVGLVSAEFFEVLGVQPLMGRLFKEGENRWGNHYVAILGYNFWQTRFHRDPAILGKSIRINDEPYTIVAVMPEGVSEWPVDLTHGKVALWTPFVPYNSGSETVWQESERGSRDWGTIARLKPGVSIQEANVDLQRIAQNLSEQYPLDRGVGVLLRPLQEEQVSGLRSIMILLMGAVLVILLIACSNVANLLLARNSSRRREIAVRVAMGAGGATLIRQFMIEHLMLGLFSGVIGGVLAWAGCAVIAHTHPAKIDQLAVVRLDLPVLAFGFVVSLLSSLIFGTLPAWIGLKVSPSEALKEGGRSHIASRGTHWLRHALVAGELALAVMLLVGTGLLFQSLLRLQNQDLGFRPDHLLRSHFYLPAVRYPNRGAITRFCDEYVARVRQLPGVQDAVVSAAYPLDDQWSQNFSIVGRPVSRLEDTPVATFNVSDSHYLQTLGVPLLKGRDFSNWDTETSPPVALVNQAFVDRYFPTEDPIGKQFRMGFNRILASRASAAPYTIIGVIGNSMNRGLVLPPLPHINTLFRQTPELNAGFKYLIVRASLDPMQLAPSIRRELRMLDAELPFAEVATMDQVIQEQTGDRRYTTGLLALFAVLGVVLAGIGVYGVVSYLVSQRTSEIGVRMALGAKRRDVIWMVVKQGLGMAGAGAAAGLLAAWILRRVVAQVVFGISPADPLTFAAAASVLIAFAACATYLPARRAAKIDPIVALRYE
jgi:predicted permease